MNYHWFEIAKVDLEDYILSDDFWSGIKVLVDRPHVINPKLLTADILETCTNPCGNAQLMEHLVTGEFCQKSIENIFKNVDVSVKPIVPRTDEDENQNHQMDSDETLSSLVIRNVLPKRFNMYKEVLEVVVLDLFEESATFYPKKSDVLNSPITPSFPYKFKLIEKRIHLEVLQHLGEEKSAQMSESEKWLEMKVLPKVSKWCQNVPKHPTLPSIQLVTAKDYNETLHYLKMKYAKQFLEIWPEYNNTNPIKYVFEDLSIAAYLITLWADERKTLNLTEKQTFVDLGCGNGFLDHILSSEGHKGIGIDLRKRKIWDVYGPETNLIEMIIEPSDNQLYPEYDWIIGNHADELTPWIPVIAARSNYNMRVFLLPCCFYTFDGKYARSHHDLTQYQSYINFLKTLCVTMGFEVQIDRLRIPSTKRTCLVCSSRTYKEEDEEEIEIKRNKFINSHSKKAEKELISEPTVILNEDPDSLSISYWNPPETNRSGSKWVTDFTPRESIECARNCTSLDKKIIDEAVMIVVNALLNTESYVSLQRDADTLLWNKGGMLKMTSLCHLFNQPVLRSMKNQRGGFQTLIRNHKSIFEVKNGFIQLRIPSMNNSSHSDVTRKKRKNYQKKKTKLDMYKQKECFFHFHHPQGCPLSSNNCTFSHEHAIDEKRAST